MLSKMSDSGDCESARHSLQPSQKAARVVSESVELAAHLLATAMKSGASDHDWEQDSPGDASRQRDLSSSPTLAASPGNKKWMQMAGGRWEKSSPEAGDEFGEPDEVEDRPCNGERGDSGACGEGSVALGHWAEALLDEHGMQELPQIEVDQQLCSPREAVPSIDVEAANTDPPRKADPLDCLTAELFEAMTSEEGARLQGMLQAVGLLKQQVEANEYLISGLEEQLAGNEKACRSVERRTLQAKDAARIAAEIQRKANQEITKWTRKRAEIERLREDASNSETLQHEWKSLELQRNQLLDTHRAHSQRRAAGKRVDSLRSQHAYKMEVARATHADRLAVFHVGLADEISASESTREAEVSHMRVVHEGRVVEFSTALDAAVRRRDFLCREKEDGVNELTARRDEGVALQQECADARKDVLHYVGEVKEAQWRAEEAPFADLLELAEAIDEDPHLEEDIEDLQSRCRQLQRECERTHQALEKKQAEADRWRDRGLATESKVDQAGDDDGPFVLG